MVTFDVVRIRGLEEHGENLIELIRELRILIMPSNNIEFADLY